ncbi:MAG: hypothetical protein BRD24_00220 [Halobacteriales archaeon SW_9_67_24]|nr:MAG: hypothetical protein BRD24_00220 [Halobacteriales archaeon SW_9_67_24]
MTDKALAVRHHQVTTLRTGDMTDDIEANDDRTPVESTYAWSPTGECAACGAAAAVRWRDGEALVCGSCKSW